MMQLVAVVNLLWTADGALYGTGAAIVGSVRGDGAGLHLRHDFQVRGAHVLHHRCVLCIAWFVFRAGDGGRGTHVLERMLLGGWGVGEGESVVLKVSSRAQDLGRGVGHDSVGYALARIEYALARTHLVISHPYV